MISNKQILYITTDLLFLDVAKAGGTAVQLSHLKILTYLGYKIRILHINCNEFKSAPPKLIKPSGRCTISGATLIIDEVYLHINDKKKLILGKIYSLIFNPTGYYYKFVNKLNIKFLNNYINLLDIGFVWAQWNYSGLLTSKLTIKPPVFYVHHDWQYKLIEFKHLKNIKMQFLKYFKKRIEYKLVKNVDAVICVSCTDKIELKQKGIKAFYMPTTYDDDVGKKLRSKSKPSLVHLGSLNTTANRVGLTNFLKLVWGNLKRELPNIKLEIIGELPLNDKELVKLLNSDKNIIIHSFVNNLDDIMYPLDIHIIPWDKNTGTRTRIPLIYKYKQCLLAIKEGVLNTIEVKNDFNGVLVSDWNEFTSEIVELYTNNEKRQRISLNGFETYKDNFLHKSQVNKLESFINQFNF